MTPTTIGTRRLLGLGLSLVALAAVVTGCREQQSFVVVTVQSIDPTPIAGVVELIVVVTNGDNTRQLIYPVPSEQIPLTLTGTLDPVTGVAGKTLSVSFTSGRGNDVLIDVAARDAAHCTVGHGHNTTVINRGGVGAMEVDLGHTTGPCEGADGGSDDGGTVFPGCDPAARTCGEGMTCAVACMAQQGQCVAAGTMPAGSNCTRNADCEPGTQCFGYATCNVSACLKFCKTDADCGPTGSGSLCQGKVPCMVGDSTILTAYHTCTFACDPRGLATTGCPVGLHCFVVDTMDQVDCSCTEASRTQGEGQSCTRGVDCAPGLICNLSTSKCQTICKRSENGADCANGQTCLALNNDQIYGVCSP